MKNERIFNRKQQKQLRQQLRTAMPLSEKILWARIRNQQLGVKFRRQHGIGRYVVDFYCPEHKLIIELDGDSHYQDEAQEYDAIRDEFMSALGLQVMRFTNSELMENPEVVVMKIYDYVKNNAERLRQLR